MHFGRILTAAGSVIAAVFSTFAAAGSAHATSKVPENCPASFSSLSSAAASTFENIAGVNLVSSLGGEPEAFRRIFVDSTKIPQLQANLKKLSAGEQAKAGFIAYLDFRLKNYPAWVKKKIYSLVGDAKIADGEVLGRAANAKTTQISLVVPNELRHNVSHYKLLAHETEIAIQEQEIAMGLITKPEQELSEFGALRAEWDFKRIFRSDGAKQDIERVKNSRLSSEQKQNEMREIGRPAETFEQFRSNRLASTPDAPSVVPVASAAPPKEALTIAPDYSRRHFAAIDDLVARRFLSKNDADQILRSGDAQKIWDITTSGKVSGDEEKKLRALFANKTDVDVVVPSAPVASASVRTEAEKKESVRLLVQKIESRYGIEDLLDEPHLLRNGKLLQFNNYGKPGAQLRFSELSLDQLGKAERPIINKFINAISMGFSSEMPDPMKVRLLSSIRSGAQGRGFEVVIVQRGHPRLIGCVKNGIYTVMMYDPHAPETMPAFKSKYAGLCD